MSLHAKTVRLDSSGMVHRCVRAFACALPCSHPFYIGSSGFVFVQDRLDYTSGVVSQCIRAFARGRAALPSLTQKPFDKPMTMARPLHTT